jgi:hypothetical protein
MGEHSSLSTGKPVDEHGIYQSECACCTALTLLAGQPLPRCLGCDEDVAWRLVQRVRPSQQPASSKASATRLKAVPRHRIDSASGDD